VSAVRLEPWYSYTHWYPMASSHVKREGLEPVPKMQPAMMMFSSKYWARRGLSLDSAMFQQHGQGLPQRHTGGQMVRLLLFLRPAPEAQEHTWLVGGDVCLTGVWNNLFHRSFFVCGISELSLVAA